jgi:hypothetical protein
MRLAHFSLKPVLRERRLDPRHEIAAIRLVVGMLELAPAAFREVTARRLLMVRPGGESPVVEQGVAGKPERRVAAARRHSVAARGDADDQLMARRDGFGLRAQLPASSSASASA